MPKEREIFFFTPVLPGANFYPPGGDFAPLRMQALER